MDTLKLETQPIHKEKQTEQKERKSEFQVQSTEKKASSENENLTYKVNQQRIKKQK